MTEIWRNFKLSAKSRGDWEENGRHKCKANFERNIPAYLFWLS